MNPITRRLFLGGIVIALFWPLRIPGADLFSPAGKKEIRLFVPGVSPADGAIDTAALSDKDAVLLDDRSLAVIARWDAESIAALRAAVQGGLGLVVVGSAALALPDSPDFSRLLGRKHPIEASPLPGPERHIGVAFVDQSHAVTQCIPHLVLRSPKSAPAAALDAAPLARAGGVLAADGAGAPIEGRPPIIWTRREGRGQVIVLAAAFGIASGLPPDSKSEKPEEDATLEVILGRAIEWAAGREISLRLPDRLPLAAEKLGRADAGLLPGFSIEKGFYRGRQIAPVMSFHGAEWLERTERQETELPERVLDALAIEPGSTVADIGAGTGYFTLRMARRVGPGGKVIAVEIQQEMLQLLRERLEKDDVHNVTAVLGSPTDPRLPEDSVSLALLVDVYHELSHPAETVAAIGKSLASAKNGRRPGRLVLVEYRGEDPAVPIKPLHRTTVQQIRAEIEPFGLRWIETKSFLPQQHIIIFER